MKWEVHARHAAPLNVTIARARALRMCANSN